MLYLSIPVAISTDILLAIIGGMVLLGLIAFFVFFSDFFFPEFKLFDDMADDAKEKKRNGHKLNATQIVGIVISSVAIILYIVAKSVAVLALLVLGVAIYYWGEKR